MILIRIAPQILASYPVVESTIGLSQLPMEPPVPVGGRVSWSIIFCLSLINSQLGDSIKFNGRHHVPTAALLLFVDEEGNWEDNWVVTLNGGGGNCNSVLFTFSEVPKCNTESVEQCNWQINNATEVDGERSLGVIGR